MDNPTDVIHLLFRQFDGLSASSVKTAIISDLFAGYNAQSLIEQLCALKKNIRYKIKKRWWLMGNRCGRSTTDSTAPAQNIQREGDSMCRHNQPAIITNLGETNRVKK